MDITNRVAKSYTADKESGFFAFPFALEQPTVRYEVSGSVAGTDIPVVPGGADYMHAVRDWVLLHAGEPGGDAGHPGCSAHPGRRHRAARSRRSPER